jgi:hypothetical protein
VIVLVIQLKMPAGLTRRLEMHDVC